MAGKGFSQNHEADSARAHYPHSSNPSACGTTRADGVTACRHCGQRFDAPPDPAVECYECAERARRLAQWTREQLATCNVPTRHRRFSAWAELRGPEPYRKAVAAVRRFAEQGNSVLAMIGTRGGGKTQAACTAVLTTIADGRSARYVTALMLLSDLRRRYDTGGGGDAAWLREWCGPRLLVIDEIAERLDTDHARLSLTALIDARYSAERPTILAGNVAPDAFGACVGPSIADRCNEGGGIVRFEGWPSFRTAGEKSTVAT